jgi:hypothetical protein
VVLIAADVAKRCPAGSKMAKKYSTNSTKPTLYYYYSQGWQKKNQIQEEQIH